MIWYHLIQAAFLVCIATLFSIQIMLFFMASATIGFLLLETVNYVEHYGLRRSVNEKGITEKVKVWHSWNSNHILGRLILFELTRHSDHHYNAGRKYQVLRHHDEAPQLPTGYPGMMMLSLVPPLWFRVMNKKIR